MIVYTVTDKSALDGIFNNGFSRQFAAKSEGIDYGAGQYCNIPKSPNQTPYESIKRFSHNPSSKCIIKCELEGGLNRYLIFDTYYAKKVYGDRYSIKDQVYRLFPEPVAKEVWNDMIWYMSFDKSLLGNSHHFDDNAGQRTSGLLQHMMSKRFHRDCANPEKYEKLFAKYNVRGAIYHGTGDGFCLVAYNYDEVIPLEYSIDGGKTYMKKNSVRRFPDAARRFRDIYKRITNPVAIKYGDTLYYFSVVQKKNGKYNVINAKNGDELSPIDFISATNITPPDGDFQIEYPENVFHYACPDGFYDEEGNGHDFSELDDAKHAETDDFSEFDFELDEDTEKTFNNILNECLEKTLDKFGISKLLLKENDVNEFHYDGVNVNTPEYFDSDNVPSVYHVTWEQPARNIFKTGSDRRFVKTRAYGTGVYSAIDIRNAMHQYGSRYGDTMIQFKIIGGYKNYLVFVEDIARKIYGEHCSILDQLKTFLPSNVAHELFNKFGYDIYSYSTIANKYDIHGSIYNWGGVIAVLTYDFSLLYPYKVSFDHARTFQKLSDNVTFERFSSSVDVSFRFGDKYKSVKMPIKYRNEDGTVTGYAVVKKRNGKSNVVEIQSGNEISPVDFDSCSNIGWEEGVDMGDFNAELNGKFYDCNVKYYKDSYGNKYSWDNFPNVNEEEDEVGEDDIDFDDIDF